MNPFYFGTTRRSLFGVYHPPRSRTPRATGIVLCYPLWQEYMRAHRAFRQLAMLLSKAGFPVLRFDYSGTGDSGGDGDSGDFTMWLEDVLTAVDELKDTAGVSRVALVGLRAGAALAALAPRDRRDVSHVLLWDPVVTGASYVQALVEEYERDAVEQRFPRAKLELGETIGVKGHPLTGRMRDTLAAVDLERAEPPAADRLAVFASDDREEYGRLHRALEARGAQASYRVIPSAGNWGEVDKWGSALLPQAIIQGIVSYITTEIAA